MDVDQHTPTGSSISCSLMKVETSTRVLTFVRTVGGVSLALATWGSVLTLVAEPSVLCAFAFPAAAAFLTGLYLRSREFLGHGEVRVADGIVRLAGRERRVAFALARIASGAESPIEHALDLELRDGRRVWLRPSDTDGRAALLRATATTVEQRAATMRLQGRLGPVLGAVLYCLLVSAALAVVSFVGTSVQSWDDPTTAVIAALGVALAAIVAIPMAQLRQPRLVVGIDGLRIRRRLRERFIPHEQVVEIVAEPHGGSSSAQPSLRVITRTLGAFALPVRGMSRTDIVGAKARIDEAVAAAERARANARFAPLFERKGRSLAAWREDLRSVLSSEGAYRQQAVTRENAEAVLDDPNTSTEQKVGAALALRTIGAGAAQDRVRIAPSAYADASSQLALTAAIEDDDAALEEALEELHPKGKKQPWKT